jgi:hypothetical protein
MEAAMKPPYSHGKALFGLAAALLLPGMSGLSAHAQSTADGAPVTITVTAEGKHDKQRDLPTLQKEDFLVYQARERRPVLSAVLQRGQDAPLDLYVLIDEAISESVTLNYKTLSAFIRELPADTRVGILYGLNGAANPGIEPTSDHEAAIKALRLPLGRIGAGGGFFLSIADLAKRAPVDPKRRRAVLLLSSGIDLFRGFSNTTPGLNPDLAMAIDYLNRNNITVYSIYVSPVGHFSTSSFLVGNGQSCLAYLGDATGGEAFFQGLSTPVDFTPLLEDLSWHLRHQYLVTFVAKPRKKAGLEDLRVTTEVSGIELRAPSQVYAPAQQ